MPENCKNYENTEKSPGTGTVNCLECATGYYLNFGICTACPSECTDCIFSSGVYCTQCDTPIKEGFDCGIRSSCTASPPINNCIETWTTSTSPTICSCKKCSPSNVLEIDVADSISSSCGSAASSGVPNCEIQANIGSPAVDACLKCQSNYILNAIKSVCVDASSFLNCKPGYLFVSDPPHGVSCNFPDTNYVPASSNMDNPIEVDPFSRIDSCKHYTNYFSGPICIACANGMLVSQTGGICSNCPSAGFSHCSKLAVLDDVCVCGR